MDNPQSDTSSQLLAHYINPLIASDSTCLEDTVYQVSRALICLTHLNIDPDGDGPRDGFNMGLDLIHSCCITALNYAASEHRDSVKSGLSRDMMMAQHADYAEKEAAFLRLAEANPQLVNEMLQSDNPARFAYDHSAECSSDSTPDEGEAATVTKAAPGKPGVESDSDLHRDMRKADALLGQAFSQLQVMARADLSPGEYGGHIFDENSVTHALGCVLDKISEVCSLIENVEMALEDKS